MRLRRESSGEILELDLSSPLGSGGEARIFAVPGDPAMVAKLYHHPTEAQARKLRVMVAAPPEDPMAAQGHPGIAWPVDLLRTADDRRLLAGFLMPRAAGTAQRRGLILDYYNPGSRRRRCPLFSYRYLLRTARNLTAAVHALHTRGYVLGDVNESNLLVSETAMVTLVDTDSFQVRDPESGSLYRCPVGKPEFTPPELQSRSFAEVDRTPEHDRFGLAVVLFQLLMEGTHPFAGVYRELGEPAPIEARIAAGHFPYGVSRPSPYRPMPIAPPFHILHPSLRALFLRCFEEGHAMPSGRPDARTWQAALEEAEAALVTCAVNSQHSYTDHLRSCPWCERTALLGGRDPFPSQAAVQRGLHLPPRPRARTPRSPAPVPVMAPLRTPSGSVRTRPPVPPAPQAAMSPPSTAPSSHGWAWAALCFALLAFLPGSHGVLGIAALICGAIGWQREKVSPGWAACVSGWGLGTGAAVVAGELLLHLLHPMALLPKQPGPLRPQQTAMHRMLQHRRLASAGHQGKRPPWAAPGQRLSRSAGDRLARLGADRARTRRERTPMSAQRSTAPVRRQEHRLRLSPAQVARFDATGKPAPVAISSPGQHPAGREVAPPERAASFAVATEPERARRRQNEETFGLTRQREEERRREAEEQFRVARAREAGRRQQSEEGFRLARQQEARRRQAGG